MTWLDKRRAHWDTRAALPTDSERIDQTPRSQRARFSTVDPLVSPRCSILDVGCGVGDLYGYLRDGTVRCDYSGVDLSPRMVERAQDKYPDGHFRTANILEWAPGPRFDLVVSIGIHSDPIPEAADVLQQIMAQQFALCRVAAHVSLLSDRYPHGPHVLAWRPEDVFAMAMKITPWVSLQHDYLPHDFSVTLWREQRP